MRRVSWQRRVATALLLFTLAVLVSACGPGAAPTPTPTKAAAPAATTAPAATPTTASPKTEATKPPAPAATPTAKPSGAAKPTGTPIKIGYLTPLTGPAAQYGFIESIGAYLGLEDVNNSGGINGRPMELVRYDSPFDPKQAVTGVRKLATEDKVFAILGPFQSSELEVAGPLANELQIPVIGMKSSKPDISEKNRPWQFRVSARDDFATQTSIAGFKKQYPNLNKVVIAGDTKSAGAEFIYRQLWPKYLKEAGYQIVGQVDYSGAITDFSAIVTKIKGMNPEAIAYGVDLSGNPMGFVKELGAQQVNAKGMAMYHMLNSPIPSQAAKELDGWIGVVNMDPEDPSIQDVMKRWWDKANADTNIVKPVPKPIMMMEYDAVKIVADIMRKANITPETPLQEARTKIRDGFSTIKDFRGLGTIGPASMRPDGDLVLPHIPVLLTGGTWKVMK